jgi:hypothetical protein
LKSEAEDEAISIKFIPLKIAAVAPLARNGNNGNFLSRLIPRPARGLSPHSIDFSTFIAFTGQLSAAARIYLQR